MKLYIAEKPSLGREIAKELGNGENKKGYIIGSDWCVTWCFGHMYENYSPEEYNEIYRYWNLETLPIIPDQWHLKSKESCNEQIGLIKKLLEKATSVVNCGDPDREGQLLVDELIQMLQWKGETQRAWIQDLSTRGLRKSLSNLESNSKYEALSNSALARSRSDWLIGMNMTRSYTVQAQRIGFKGVLSVGRVQTPTLNMIVSRDLEIEDFKAYEFYEINGKFNYEGIEFSAKWKTPEELLNSDGKCVLKTEIEKYLNQLSSCGQAEVVSFKSQVKHKKAPLPFSLSNLQSYCSDKFGYSASDVLQIAQSLYEHHKVITYPRTDCSYLSEGQWEEVLSTLDPLRIWLDLGIDLELDLSKPGVCFDDKKITAHTGIIPTGVVSSDLNEAEKNVFDAISKRLLMQFMPDFTFSESKLELSVDLETFFSTGKVLIDAGWQKLDPPKKTSSESVLPNLKDVKSVQITCFESITKTTRPPKRFTEGALIKAMVNIGRYLAEKEDKQIMRETEGIGTEATRAGIIENLKKKGFIEKKGKTLFSTSLGRKMISVVHESVKSPVLTAQWEKKLKELEHGNISIVEFMNEQQSWLREVISIVTNADFSAFGGKRCPKCETGYLVEKKGKYSLFIGCSSYPNCKYIPKSAKKTSRRRRLKHG
ncbi:DNA topoisomerase 3 [Marinicella sp. W31]|uniref:DNA topoisomerase 3 n=1 Tax=Marinicella sp. W31 TaxID=3023713 RepID=UPI003757BA1A